MTAKGKYLSQVRNFRGSDYYVKRQAERGQVMVCQQLVRALHVPVAPPAAGCPLTGRDGGLRLPSIGGAGAHALKIFGSYHIPTPLSYGGLPNTLLAFNGLKCTRSYPSYRRTVQSTSCPQIGLMDLPVWRYSVSSESPTL